MPYADENLKTQTRRRLKRQEAFLKALTQDVYTIGDAAEMAGVSRKTIDTWRDRDRAFNERVKIAVAEARTRKAMSKYVSREVSLDKPRPDKGSFAEWRRKYTGRIVEKHQEGFVAAFEDRTNQKILWLAPTGAGKDTTAGDVCMYVTCDDWTQRAAWLMENENFSRRRIAERIKPYFEDSRVYDQKPLGINSVKPSASLIADYGPFTWEKGMRFVDGTPVPRNTWTKNELYFMRGMGESEADPNLWASGLGGASYGARITFLVLSDPFTFENQSSPTQRAQQRALLEEGGTIATRLDGSGRTLVLGTRVAEWDNYGEWMKSWTQNARVIDHQEFWATDYYKYSNGVAVVITRAIVENEDGEEVSFWPDNPEFPLDSYLELDGKRYLVKNLDDARYNELAAKGAHRVKGLREKRAENPERFETTQQQNPPEGGVGEFTDILLDHCDDPSRTLGVWKPGEELLVQGVDPARSGGAAWVMWGYDRETGICTVVDLFYGEKLGTEGVRKKLLLEPASHYLPAYLVYEVNAESGVLDHPDVKRLVEQTGTSLIRHHTQYNRSQGDASVAAMSTDMRTGLIRFPAAHPQDRERLRKLKQHFKNWDIASAMNRRTISGRYGHQPDDLCMAAWIGWYHIKTRMKNRGLVGRVAQRPVPQAIMKRWRQAKTQTFSEPQPVSTYNMDEPDPNDLAAWYDYYGGTRAAND